MRVIVVKCPKCGMVFIPPKGREKDEINLCENCGTSFIMENGSGRVVDREIGKFEISLNGEKVYVPFWVVKANIRILSEVNLRGFMGMFSRDSRMEGTYDIYILATDHTLDYVKSLSQALTVYGPRIPRSEEFETSKILPASMSMDDAKKMAEFLFITYEGEKPGILQRLDYIFKVEDVRVFYAPFYMVRGNLQYGFAMR